MANVQQSKKLLLLLDEYEVTYINNKCKVLIDLKLFSKNILKYKNNNTNLKNIDKYEINSQAEIYIPLDTAFKLIKRRNNTPEIINIHKTLNITDIHYMKQAKTLYPIISYLKNNNIEYEIEYHIKEFNCRIDLFIINAKIGIECDENNHNQYNINSEEMREEAINSYGIQLIRYNPDDKKFDINIVINKIKKLLRLYYYKIHGIKSIINYLKEINDDELMLLLSDYLCKNDNDLCINLDKINNNIFKLLNLNKNKCIKIIKTKMIKFIDYVINNENSNENSITITKLAFKTLCLLSKTIEGINICKWILNTERDFNNELNLINKMLLNENNILTNTNRKRSFDKFIDDKTQIKMKKQKNCHDKEINKMEHNIEQIEHEIINLNSELHNKNIEIEILNNKINENKINENKNITFILFIKNIINKTKNNKTKNNKIWNYYTKYCKDNKMKM